MLPSGKDLAALGKAVKPTAVMAPPHRMAVSISRRSISCMVFYSTEFEAKERPSKREPFFAVIVAGVSVLDCGVAFSAL